MRWLGSLGLATLAVLSFAASTLAQDGECELEVERRLEAGFLAIGSGFEPDESVEIQLFFGGEAVFPTPSTKTADETGTVTEFFTSEPGDPPGTYTVTATADSCEAEGEFEILPDTAAHALVTPGPRAFDVLLVFTAGVATFIYFVTRPGQSGVRRG